MKLSPSVVSYIQVTPLALILFVFFGIPLATVVIISFFDYDNFQAVPAFIFLNYIELFESNLIFTLYLNMIKFSVIVWAITLVIGFTVSYFLVFHVRSLLWKIFFFLACTVPFWTSNIIRMISWIPVLGRNGLVNQTLMALGIVDEPLDFLLFSDFSVVVAYVHLFALFMVVTLFNSMARIDPAGR
jgi:putative spermidine/putrescine transport system permease protein